VIHLKICCLMLTTTLHRAQLDVVAGAPLHGKAQGELQLNGVPRAQTHFKEMSCYVMQRDVLLESATVSAAAAMAALQQVYRLLAVRRKLTCSSRSTYQPHHTSQSQRQNHKQKQ
jgi:hypothetical protein